MQSSPVIASRVEGILVYFDAKKRAFLDSIPRYGEFLKNHNIECGILLCDRLPEDECDGITYREAKTQGMALDLIELHPENEDESCDSPEEASFLEPIGYDELAKALRSYIWSNVENVTNGNSVFLIIFILRNSMFGFSSFLNTDHSFLNQVYGINKTFVGSLIVYQKQQLLPDLLNQ